MLEDQDKYKQAIALAAKDAGFTRRDKLHVKNLNAIKKTNSNQAKQCRSTAQSAGKIRPLNCISK